MSYEHIFSINISAFKVFFCICLSWKYDIWTFHLQNWKRSRVYVKHNAENSSLKNLKTVHRQWNFFCWILVGITCHVRARIALHAFLVVNKAPNETVKPWKIFFPHNSAVISSHKSAMFRKLKSFSDTLYPNLKHVTSGCAQFSRLLDYHMNVVISSASTIFTKIALGVLSIQAQFKSSE